MRFCSGTRSPCLLRCKGLSALDYLLRSEDTPGRMEILRILLKAPPLAVGSAGQLGWTESIRLGSPRPIEST